MTSQRNTRRNRGTGTPLGEEPDLAGIEESSLHVVRDQGLDDEHSDRNEEKFLTKEEFTSEMSALRNEIRNLFSGLNKGPTEGNVSSNSQQNSENHTPLPVHSSHLTEEEPEVPNRRAVSEPVAPDHESLLEERRAARLAKAGLSAARTIENPRRTNDEWPRDWSVPLPQGIEETYRPVPSVQPRVLTSTLEPAQGRKGKIYIKKPDTFSGERPSELKPFLRSLEYIFISEPDSYGPRAEDADTRKVITALSYLTDIAREWASSLEDHAQGHLALSNWTVFKEALSKAFSDPYEKEDAQRQLEQLRHSTRSNNFNEYLINFNRLCHLAQFQGEAARRVFYNGLSNRVKDALANHPHGYDSLAELQEAAGRLVSRLNERDRESRGTTSLRPSRETSRPKSSGRARTGESASGESKNIPRRSGNPPRNTERYGSNAKMDGEAKKVTFEKVACYNCGGGHYARDCTRPRTSRVNALASHSDESDDWSNSDSDEEKTRKPSPRTADSSDEEAKGDETDYFSSPDSGNESGVELSA
ncbi:unnamed protein product [Parajaminaea phylloscopi]